MDTNFLHTIPEIESPSYRSSRFSDESDDFGDEELSNYSSDEEELDIADSDSIVFDNSSTSDDSMQFITTRGGKSKEMYADHTSSKKHISNTPRNNNRETKSETMKPRAKQINSAHLVKNQIVKPPKYLNPTTTSIKKSSLGNTSYEKAPHSSSHNTPTFSQSERTLFSSRSEKGQFFDMLEGSRSNSETPLQLNSTLSQNIEELNTAERRFSLARLSQKEKEEYKTLIAEYKQNEKQIKKLKEDLDVYCAEYIELKTNQTEEINALKQSQEEYFQKYRVKELSDRKKAFISQSNKRQDVVLSRIEDMYKKQVVTMYNNTRAIVQNMNRSFFGKVLFSIVYILEFVWNWLKQEWGHIKTNLQKNDRSKEEEITLDLQKKKQGKVRKQEKRKTKKTGKRIPRK